MSNREVFCFLLIFAAKYFLWLGEIYTWRLPGFCRIAADRQTAAGDRGWAVECSAFRTGHGARTGVFWWGELLFLWAGASCLKRRVKGCFQARALRAGTAMHWAARRDAVGTGALRGILHPLLPADGSSAKCWTGWGLERQQHWLRLPLGLCGPGAIGRDLSAAGCYLSIVSVAISVLESHAYIYVYIYIIYISVCICVYESFMHIFLLLAVYSLLEQRFKHKHLNEGLTLGCVKNCSFKLHERVN